MDIMKLKDLNIDRNGLEYVEHLDQRFPVTVFHDEIDKMTNGCIRWHWHPQLEFILALSDIEIHTADEQLHLSAGDGAFINAGQLHMACPAVDGAPSSAHTLLFAPELIAPADSLIFEKYLRPVITDTRLPFILLQGDNPEHISLLQLLKETIECYQHEDKCAQLRLRNQLSRLWLGLVESIDSFPQRLYSQQNRQSQFRLKQMLSFIRQNYVNRITLDDIAGAALVSKSECLRCFRSRFDMTPIQYLIQCRLELACHLLSSTNMNVKEISSKCGFDDAGYFGRVFRKRHGLTPLSYREKIKVMDRV